MVSATFFNLAPTTATDHFPPGAAMASHLTFQLLSEEYQEKLAETTTQLLAQVQRWQSTSACADSTG